MPAFGFQELALYCGRQQKYRWKIYDEETGDPVEIGLTDVILAKLTLRQGGTPVLDLTSADYDGGANGPPTVSSVQILTRGSVGNPDPDNDYPAEGFVWILQDDTESIPDGWQTTEQEKRYWLELVRLTAAGNLVPFGKGRLLLHRSATSPAP
jgi:hypothetical protein